MFSGIVAGPPLPIRAAFHLRRTGPWDQDLYLLESTDGVRFGSARLFVTGGGVASVIRDAKGRLIAAFQWFPRQDRDHFDRIAVKISTDDGRKWSEPQPIELQGMPGTYRRPCDPTLVLLDDGRIRMYFTSDERGRRRMGPGAGTYSAISADGVNYTFEPGARFALPDGVMLDCAVVRLGKTWHYYAPVQGGTARAYHATSTDGLAFKRQPDISLSESGQWLGCAVATKAGLRFYGSGGRGGWSAVSRDGFTWRLERPSPRTGADPGVVQTRTGRFLMIGTGPRSAGKATRRDAVPVRRTSEFCPWATSEHTGALDCTVSPSKLLPL